MKNIIIRDINNHTPFGSTICGNYKNDFSFVNSVPGFLGADVRGISVESCHDVFFKNVYIKKMKSSHGNVIGIDVMFESKDIKGHANVS